MTSILNIIMGILILFFSSGLLIGLYSMVYVRYLVKTKNEVRVNNYLSIAVTSLVWIVATFISILTASAAGLFVFALVSLLLIFGFNYFLCEKLFGLTGSHKLIYSLTLGVIINPAWLSLLGVL